MTKICLVIENSIFVPPTQQLFHISKTISILPLFSREAKGKPERRSRGSCPDVYHESWQSIVVQLRV